MDQPPKYPTFYVDDSACEIAGRKHFILAAVTYESWEDEIAAKWIQEKANCGLPSHQEVKWNSRELPLERRRAFIPLASAGTGLIVVDEEDKQHAAGVLAKQVSDYCLEMKALGFRLRFDKNIVSDWKGLTTILDALPLPCIGLSESDSKHEQLLQAADFLAGSAKLSIDLGLGQKNRNERIILGPGIAEGYALSDDEVVDLGWFMFASLRHCIWGETALAGERQNDPWKITRGKGAVLYSSLPNDQARDVFAALDGFFMGCIN